MMMKTMMMIANIITVTINPVLELEHPLSPEDTRVGVVEMKMLFVYCVTVVAVVRPVVLEIAVDVAEGVDNIVVVELLPASKVLYSKCVQIFDI